MPPHSDTDQLAAAWADEYLQVYGFPPDEVMAEPFFFLPSVQASLPMPVKDFCNATESALKLIAEARATTPMRAAPAPPPSPVRRFSATDPPKRIEHPDRLD
jgi:hypothetical protein